jgi:hypothetical protein
MTTALSEDENPIAKFYRIKNEIDLIEKDLEFYNKNVNFILFILERIIYQQVLLRKIIFRAKEL